ncbi:MAG: DUF1348 family protein [Bryobacteraceae bacterium]|nr:DUF1348 family protein [Bryobacteraceae bacterium]
MAEDGPLSWLLRRKWNKELSYKLKKELWGFRNNRMAVSARGRDGLFR